MLICMWHTIFHKYFCSCSLSFWSQHLDSCAKNPSRSLKSTKVINYLSKNNCLCNKGSLICSLNLKFFSLFWDCVNKNRRNVISRITLCHKNCQVFNLNQLIFCIHRNIGTIKNNLYIYIVIIWKEWKSRHCWR